MNPRWSKTDSFREAWLPNLVLPVRVLQPSLVLLCITASFLIAFSLTFCFVGNLPKSEQIPSTLPSSLGLIEPF